MSPQSESTGALFHLPRRSQNCSSKSPGCGGAQDMILEPQARHSHPWPKMSENSSILFQSWLRISRLVDGLQKLLRKNRQALLVRKLCAPPIARTSFAPGLQPPNAPFDKANSRNLPQFHPQAPVAQDRPFKHGPRAPNPQALFAKRSGTQTRRLASFCPFRAPEPHAPTQFGAAPPPLFPRRRC